jgi:asparagine synthase (glutamine-hydrolysing)
LYEENGIDCLQKFDGHFAILLRDGNDFFVARDPIGIKPLYYAKRDEGRIFASELKAFGKMCSNYREFPPGCFYHSRSGKGRFYSLPEPSDGSLTIDKAAPRLRLAIETAVGRLTDVGDPSGVFLSGGLDSSILAWLLGQIQTQVRTFSVGLAGSADIVAAERAAGALGCAHTQRILHPDEVVEILPKVIHLLESFDAQVVRSAVCNYYLAESAKKHVSSVQCGDGADELFGGHASLRELPPAERNACLWRLTSGLHNTELQRMDRMTMAHGLEARVPFLDRQVIALAFSLPDWMKTGANGESKWILRHAFSDELPNWILRQPRRSFAEGAGVDSVLRAYAEREITDSMFAGGRAEPWSEPLRNKEEVLYYRLWRKHFVPEMGRLVGRSQAA